MVTNILVTGATGNVGREVVQLLSAQNFPVTAAVRNPIETSKSFGSNVRCVLFDFTNPDTFADAFAGIDKLFFVRPPAIAEASPLKNRPPISIQQYVEDYRQCWLSEHPSTRRGNS